VADFHNLKIKEIYKDTDDCSVVTFEVPSEISKEFHFRQGQHLTLKTDIDGEDTRRSYSLCSSPIDAQWKVAVKLIPGGKFSTFINDTLQAGDMLEVMAPSGNFGVETNNTKAKNYLFFAAGSGITPVLSMVIYYL
jgi:ring-1,2-phenylacetyl-CoA epoxidase subunit PaaE